MTTTETPRDTSRKITVECLTRVEGEGGLSVRVEDDQVTDVKVTIFEPPRLFEAFLEHRHYSEVPDITARICGICPVAYQMSSIHALEAAFGVEITPEIRTLRRLLYCAEWIESHALHIYLLNAPDFLGYESALTLARDHPELVEKGLRLKKIGNRLLEILGGRPSHPVSPCVGGFTRSPRRKDLQAILPDLEWAISAAEETVEIVSSLQFPDFEQDYEMVALSHPDEYALNEGEIVSSRGLRIPVDRYEDEFLEEHVEHSTALHSVRASSGREPTSSARWPGSISTAAQLLPHAAAALEKSPLTPPCRNPFLGIIARAVELVQACEEAWLIVDDYEQPAISRVPVVPGASHGCAVTEAPRGILYHHYRISSSGLVESARIVPPTAQNLHRMEEDLRAWLPRLLPLDDTAIRNGCEHLIRTYDPCISCSTHFIRLDLQRT